MKLSDNDIRDINRLLLEGKPLPEKYRFLLFEEKREVELVWNGKSNEVCNIVLPFQTIESVDEPRSERKKGRLMTLSDFDVDDRGRQRKGWSNKLIWGDNKLILSSLKNGPLREEIERNGGIKLIYIDPPFDVGADFSMPIQIGENEITKKPNVLEEIAYRDTWGLGEDSFIAMMYERLRLMHSLLSKDGSIFVHCDYRVSHFIRMVLNEIFGKECFRNHIIWCYSGGGIPKSELPKKHDDIFWYTKSKDVWTYNPVYRPYSEGTLERGRTAIKGENATLRAEGTPINDWWPDVKKITSPTDPEKLYYPTQKSEELLKRIVTLTTNQGDIIADFFCGSGTTLAVAEKLGRKWIGADLGKFSIHTTRKRLIGVQRELKQRGGEFRAFEVLNLGKYERQHYVGINPNLSDSEKTQQIAKRDSDFTRLILNAYHGEAESGYRTFHGKKAGRLISIGPINLPVTRLFIEEIILECREKRITKVDVLAFEYEMGLFPNIQEEAKNKGIDLVLKYIPREVFDKRAIEKDQVVFHDVAYIEVKHIVKGKKVSVELTDFSVFYNQDILSNAEAEINEARPGASKIIVFNGKILKLTKVEGSTMPHRQVLTEKWSDWIDYWAVDFDFENRREIINVKMDDGSFEEVWTGDFVFENEWQSFRTKTNRDLELKSVTKDLSPGKHKIAVKVVDIFGNDTMKVVEIDIKGE